MVSVVGEERDFGVPDTDKQDQLKMGRKGFQNRALPQDSSAWVECRVKNQKECCPSRALRAAAREPGKVKCTVYISAADSS